jgi:hypothetical protein
VMDPVWKLEEFEPGAELDRRVRRRMGMFTNRLPERRAAPFLPLEQAVYAVVLAVYVLYASARAVRVFQESREPQWLAQSSVSRRAHSPRPCEPASSLSWRRQLRWWS